MAARLDWDINEGQAIPCGDGVITARRTFQKFFSQDERYTVSSPDRTLTVLPLPTAGQPSGFAGATGVNLKLERQITPSTARANEAVNVEVAVRGEGNVALWP